MATTQLQSDPVKITMYSVEPSQAASASSPSVVGNGINRQVTTSVPDGGRIRTDEDGIAAAPARRSTCPERNLMQTSPRLILPPSRAKVSDQLPPVIPMPRPKRTSLSMLALMRSSRSKSMDHEQESAMQPAVEVYAATNANGECSTATMRARMAGTIFSSDDASSNDSASFRTGGRYRVPTRLCSAQPTTPTNNHAVQVIPNGAPSGKRNLPAPRSKWSTASNGGVTAVLSPVQHPRGDDPIVTINVAGVRFQTYESTLQRFPNSLLGDPAKRQSYWDKQLEEYFFDRHRLSFESILHIYQSGGQVLRPETVPIPLFLRELRFYEFGDEILENFWESEGYKKPCEDTMPANKWQRRAWELMEYPDSSLLARVLACFSIGVIIISIVSFCLETIPELRGETAHEREWNSPFFWIEFICCTWFSVELTVRFLACPNKPLFMRSFLNWLDFVAVAPFFVNLMWASEHGHDKSASSLSFSVLRIMRLVRVFRIFKLSRHSVGLQVLGKTFRASVQEFCLLIFFMVIALVLFSSGVYFAEQGDPNTKFTSIPASFWFVLATMTTVGYGDLVPHGLYGKIVGSMCALIGVLTLALPVPIIVANFKHFYRQECRLAQMYAQNKHGSLVGEDLYYKDETKTAPPEVDTGGI